MPTASSYDGALLRVVHQRVADLRSQLRTLSVAYASCAPGRDDRRMEELEHDMASLACRLEHERAMLHELEAAGENRSVGPCGLQAQNVRPVCSDSPEATIFINVEQGGVLVVNDIHDNGLVRQQLADEQGKESML